MKKCILAAALVFGCVSSLAQAADAEDAVEFRQGVFRAMGWNFAPMGAMIQGRKPWDAETFAQGAERVALLASMAPEGFIEGTGKRDGLDTRLRDEYGYQQEHFNKLMTEMIEKAADFSRLVAEGKDREALRPAFGQLAKSCKSCHDEYRGRE